MPGDDTPFSRDGRLGRFSSERFVEEGAEEDERGDVSPNEYLRFDAVEGEGGIDPFTPLAGGDSGENDPEDDAGS